MKLNTPLKSWMVTDLAFYKNKSENSDTVPPPPPEFEHKPGEIYFSLEELQGAAHNKGGVRQYTNEGQA